MSARDIDEKAPDGPKLHLSRFRLRDGEVQGMVELREPARLVNVRLWLLRLVVVTWMRAARNWPRPVGKQLLGKYDWPLLSIAMTPGTIYRESTALARVDSGPPLRRWQKAALRLAYVFSSVRRERFGIQVKSILEEMESDVRTAAGKPDVEAFERGYETLVALHVLLLGASLDRADDGSIGSWALLPDIESFAERALYARWANTYRSIFQAAIGAMVTDVRPIRRLCHLAQHLEGKDVESSPIEVRENILQLPPLMMFQLSGWWVQRVEEQRCAGTTRRRSWRGLSTTA